MAIVKGPLHSEQASGNMGSLCYSRWRGRAVVRSAYTGTDPNTADQQEQRAILSACSTRWGSTLSSDQRRAWEELARSITFPDRFGEMRNPSGFQLFMRRNIIRQIHFTTYIDTPDEGGETFFAEILELEYQIVYPRVYVRFRYGSTRSNEDGLEFWRAGPYDSPGRRPIAGEWRHKEDKDPPASWYDYSIDTGKYYWYRGRAYWESGVVSNWFEEQVAT